MTNTNILVVEASESERSVFYKKVYGHLAAAIILFIIVESILLSVIPRYTILSMIEGFNWLFILGGFWLASLFSNRLATSQSKTVQYLGLALYIFIEAVIFLPLIFYVAYTNGEEVITQASIITFMLFVAITTIVFISNKDFSILKNILIIGGFISLGFIVAGIAFGFNLGLWFTTAMILIASGSILYETYQIKNKYTTDQYVGASLTLFASIMLLFWYIIRLFISSDD